MARKFSLRHITEEFWAVSHVLRSPHSTAPVYTAEQAFRKLRKADFLRPDQDWRLIELMHTLKYDIIEGNTEWRGSPQETNSASIHHIKDWISTQQTAEVQSQIATQSR